jgi:hypothetical protein
MHLNTGSIDANLMLSASGFASLHWKAGSCSTAVMPAKLQNLLSTVAVLLLFLPYAQGMLQCNTSMLLL